MSVVDHVRGGVAKNRFITGGDLGSIIFTLHDKSGAVMPPEPELVTVEVDGGYTIQDIESFAGTYNLYMLVMSDDEPGVGEVRIRSVDGRLLGAFPFYKRINGDTGVDLARSSAFLELALDSEAPATHSVKIYPINDFNEFTGPGTIVDLSIDGGSQGSAPVMIPGGGLQCLVEADPTAEQLTVDVSLDGQFFTTLTAELEPVPDEPVSEASTDEPDVVETDVVEEPAASERASGCGGCASSGLGGDLWWILMSLLALRTRRRAL